MGVAEAGEVGADFLFGGFVEGFAGELFFVGGHVGHDEAGEAPAGPCAPCAEFGAGAAHAGGEVLPVPSGVADELVAAVVLQEPDDGGVGQGMGLMAGEFAAEGAVEEEEGAGGEALEPEALGVVEGGVVEGGAALLAVGVEAVGVEFLRGHGEERAGGEGAG